MGEGSYSTFDHTADIGLALEAPTLELLFETAGAALFDTMIERMADPRAGSHTQLEVDLAASTTEELLVRWLSELLYLHETRELVIVSFEVLRLAENHLTARVGAERFDPGLHRMKREVKAVTYHQLAVTPDEKGWSARLVLDV